jgi:hypothetical protein
MARKSEEMQAVATFVFHIGDVWRELRRRYRRALAHRLAEARREERRLRDSLPRT